MGDTGVTSLSSEDLSEEADEDDETEARSGAWYTSGFVADRSSTGPEILPRLMVPAEYLIRPSRKGIGVEISGRLWRFVKARVIDAMAIVYLA
jgi:hypothetical protein